MGLQKEIDKVKAAILAESTFSREKSKSFDEVFTRFEEVSLILDRAGDDYWSNPDMTYYDPCAGKGNFPIIVVEKFFQGLARCIPNEEMRMKNIIERQLFMSELQFESVNFIKDHFRFNLDIKINLFHGNSLEKPADWFQKDWYERDSIMRRHPYGYNIEPPSQPMVAVVDVTSAEKEAKRIIRDAEKRLAKALKAEERLEAKLKAQADKKAAAAEARAAKKKPKKSTGWSPGQLTMVSIDPNA